ncbi:MAG TPA: hypothetical protein VFP80_12865 [Thermoanaerobaculia bacterium]|nr:hypothetical protein [Thermoanaerobaculia bacterium]
MNFDEQLERIRAAGTDPQAQALATLDIVLSGRPPELLRALEAAAIPHWFDETILAAIVDPDLRAAAPEWFRAVTELSAVEPFRTRRGAYNVHESTRLALRRRLNTASHERFIELTRRAAAAFSDPSTPVRIERMFHSLAEKPDEAANELRRLEFELRANPEDALALASVLREYARDPSWSPAVRGWSLIIQTMAQADYVTVDEALGYARQARDCFVAAGSLVGQALAHIRIGDHLLSRQKAGDLELARASHETALDLTETIVRQQPDSLDTAAYRALALQQAGQYYQLFGQGPDRNRALDMLRQANEIRERVYSAKPDDIRAARSVSISLSYLGKAYLDRDEGPDYEPARLALERALEISESILSKRSINAQAVRDVGVAATSLADLLVERRYGGDLQRALALYQRSLELSERLYVENPVSVTAARDLALDLMRVGDFLLKRDTNDDFDIALSSFERALEITERLWSSDPASFDIARDAVYVLDRLATLHRAPRGNPGRALEYSLRELEVTTQLREANPQSTRTALDHLAALSQVGRSYEHRGAPGDGERARQAFLTALQAAESLYAAEPQHVDVARVMALSLGETAQRNVRNGNLGAETGAYFDRCVGILTRIHAANPDSPQSARDLALAHYDVAEYRQAAGTPELARESLAACYRVLHSFEQAAWHMDAEIQGMYDSVKKRMAADEERGPQG